MDDDIDSSCSTPFASAPSSPGRSPAVIVGGGYFFSAPASPIHHLLFSSSAASAAAGAGGRGCAGDAEFEFGGPGGPMISADELFHNGQIRPLTLPPLPDLDPGSDEEDEGRAPARGRDLTPRCASVHRRARSMSPLRSASPRLKLINALVPAPDLAPPRPRPRPRRRAAGGGGRAARHRLVALLLVLLHVLLVVGRLVGGARVPAVGVHQGHAPPPQQERARARRRRQQARPCVAVLAVLGSQGQARRAAPALPPPPPPPPAPTEAGGGGEDVARPHAHGRGRRRRSTTVAAAHERLYAAPNRAQAEEMRRRTFLPYRQGLLGCLGFRSRGYGALHGLTKTLNPVFSR
ncbi:hypothetical protein U9M48_007156 [Paspalum notatum var. saurae]|uniref:Uncharacterized protein n=1 Tax=Paspalum notatum var. saurae TaxID=547442 RepID=A0AAQ3Q124_PASNO